MGFCRLFIVVFVVFMLLLLQGNFVFTYIGSMCVSVSFGMGNVLCNGAKVQRVMYLFGSFRNLICGFQHCLTFAPYIAVLHQLPVYLPVFSRHCLLSVSPRLVMELSCEIFGIICYF